MTDFLLELRSEEIPARMQKGARAELIKLFRREMDAAGVSTGAITVWSTPRRLALIARDLPVETDAVREEAKGPPEAAPDQAVDGFCRKNGVTRDQLEVRDIKGRPTFFAVIEKPGRAVGDVLAVAIPAIIRDFAWPKSMRWGEASMSTESLRWVRPLSGIVALLGNEIVECEVHGVTSGAVTLGHRFHHSGDITIGNADNYAMKLRAAHVIVDHAEREDLIRIGAAQVAKEAGLDLVEDESLVIENAGLTEWPVPLLGRFEDDFLSVPPEVIQLTARVNQKYFVCEKGGKLANAFICTANIESTDGGAAIVDGNRKVLAARLSDARFFWDVDRKKTLEEHAKGLERITFHEKLGTVADKVERVAKLAEWLASEGIVPDCNPKLARQAAELCKADLVTEMVGEFPELQGLMGGYYARAEGLPDAVADAIRDHYKPVGQGDEVPTAPVTVAVSLADKLDTLAMFFAVDERPTGSKDPFALRRAAIGVIELISSNRLRLDLAKALLIPPMSMVVAETFFGHGKWEIDEQNLEFGNLLFRTDAIGIYSSRWDLMDGFVQITAQPETVVKFEDVSADMILEMVDLKFSPVSLLEFLTDRLKVQQREAGVRHDIIDAVLALGGEDDFVRLLARVHALQAFIETDNGTNLLAGYKRAANILKKEDWPTNSSPLQGRGGSAAGAEGEGNDTRPADMPAPSSPHPSTPSPERDGENPLEPHTGEEDPFALVDDPAMREVVAAQIAVNKALSYTPEPAEKELIDALDSAEPQAQAAIEGEDFTAAMSALASLRAPIDAFFEEVTVNDNDPAKRGARLDLLARFRNAVHSVADFSRIEG